MLIPRDKLERSIRTYGSDAVMINFISIVTRILGYSEDEIRTITTKTVQAWKEG